MSNSKKTDRPDPSGVDRGFPIKSTFFNPAEDQAISPKPEFINTSEKNNYYEELEQAEDPVGNAVLKGIRKHTT